jgi:outer membrane protein OmpA-like peptidoglycan-associated protein
MSEDFDQGTRVGLWTVASVIILVLLGLGSFVLRGGLHGKAAPASATAAAPTAVLEVVEVLYEGPLTGDVLGTVYFAIDEAAVPADAAPTIEAVKAALQADATRQVVLSGFHDATGDPARNADLAKARAKAVRAALQAAGLPLERLLLRKPENTTGDGDDKQARRVEIRLLP